MSGFNDPSSTDTIGDLPVTTSESAFMAEAMKRWMLADNAESEMRRDALEDALFSVGDQWPDNVKKDRSAPGVNRPCLTINQLPQFIHQITNDARQNRPMMIASPVNDGTDQETADVITGLFRHIETQSDAAIAYDTALDWAVRIGWGYIRVNTRYVNENSFEQEICLERVKNPFSVYCDPSAQGVTYEDMEWAFVTEDLPRDKYREMYPKSMLASLSQMTALGDNEPDWATEDNIRIADYFYTVYKEEKIHLLDDGSVILEQDLTDDMKSKIKKSRETKNKQIKWAKINAIEKLEETDWPGSFIPLVPVLGEDLYVDGKRHLHGLVYAAKDPQRMYNYMSTSAVEAVALAPKSPWVIADSQIGDYRAIWETANVKTHSHLPWRPSVVEGTQIPVPPPQRNASEPPVQALMQSVQMADQQMKVTTGIYQANLGQRSNEISGKAIQARQKEGDISNYHFSDNLARAIRQLGRIVLDLIPHIYDTARVVRIIDGEDNHKLVKINQPSGKKDENGIDKVFDMTVGEYDVVLNTGPSYSTKREQAADMMMQAMQAWPQLMPIAGDLMMKNFDWPGAEALSERMKMALPPNIQQQIQAADQSQKTNMPPEALQMLAQAKQMIGQLTQQLNAATHTIQTKAVENQSKERVAMINAQAEQYKAKSEIVKALVADHSKANHTVLMSTLDGINAAHSALAAAAQNPQPQNSVDNAPAGM